MFKNVPSCLIIVICKRYHHRRLFAFTFEYFLFILSMWIRWIHINIVRRVKKNLESNKNKHFEKHRPACVRYANRKHRNRLFVLTGQTHSLMRNYSYLFYWDNNIQKNNINITIYAVRKICMMLLKKKLVVESFNWKRTEFIFVRFKSIGLIMSSGNSDIGKIISSGCYLNFW